MKHFKQSLVLAFSGGISMLSGASAKTAFSLEQPKEKGILAIMNPVLDIKKKDDKGNNESGKERALNDRNKKGKKSAQPSSVPSAFPTVTSMPSSIPSSEPSTRPSPEPSLQPSVCRDEPEWQVGGSSKFKGMRCIDIKSEKEGWCNLIQSLHNSTFAGKSIFEACCDCGGGDHQTIIPSTTPSSPPSISTMPTQQHFPSETPTARPTDCEDEPGWIFTAEEGHNLGCSALESNPAELCLAVESVIFDSKPASLACCVCGGGNHLSVAPSGKPTSEPTSDPSSQPSISSAPSDEPSFKPSQSPSDTPSSSPSSLPTISMQPSIVPSMTFATAFDGDSCNYDVECRERPKYSRARDSCASSRRKAARSRNMMTSGKGGKGGKKTSRMPSSRPSTLPTKIPSTSPSSVPTSSPSSIPSKAPSALPSSEPSSNPSKSPSSSPSSFPTLLPTSLPSVTPSDHPSLFPSIAPSGNPSTVPSLSTVPSSRPQHFGRCDLNHQCVAQNLKITMYNEMTKTATEGVFAGSYGNAVGGKNDGSHDQDFSGGVVVHDDQESDTLSMFGNAWKAYKLENEFQPTKSSYIEFNFTVVTEAEGHAICLDEDVDEDTFGGSRRRCIMLAGTQVDRWDNVKKYNIGSSEIAEARQSSNGIFLHADAEKAIDGVINPYWNGADDEKFNSISKTQEEDNPWWEVYLGKDFEIHDIIIYNRLDDSYIDVLSNFTLWILRGDDIYNFPNDGNTVDQINVSVGEAFDKHHIRLDPHPIGNRVRITLNKTGSLQLAEVVIMGRDVSDECGSRRYSIPIGDLFAGSEEKIKYISFIQDNDSDSSAGESEFSDIQLVTKVPPSIVAQSWKLNENRLFDIADKNMQNCADGAKIHLSEDPKTTWTVVVEGRNLKVLYNECVANLSDFLKDKQVSPTNTDNWGECIGNPCDRCRGDCDNNDECKGSLLCQQRNSGDVGRSCIGSDSSGYDYCVPPVMNDKKVPCGNPASRVMEFDKILDHWENQQPSSVSVANNGRIIVGYKQYTYSYKAPSDRPSSMPSSIPSKSPTDSPTSSPTGSPTATPPTTRRSLSESTIDATYHGAILIIDPKKRNNHTYDELDNFKTLEPQEQEWIFRPFTEFPNNNLRGDANEDLGFGSTVAISADSSTIAITSPDFVNKPNANAKGRVQIYRYDNEDWIQKGKTDPFPTAPLYSEFGETTVLSTNGDYIAASANINNEPYHFVVFKWNGDGKEWIEMQSMNAGKAIKALSISIGKNVGVDVLHIDGDKKSYELIGICRDVNSKAKDDNDDLDTVQCICRDGFLSSGGKGNLLQGDSEYCVACSSANNVVISASTISFTFNRYDKKVSSRLDNDDTILFRHEPDEDVQVKLTKNKFSSVDVDNDKEEFSFSVLQPGFRYTTTLTQQDDKLKLVCPIVTSCSCDHSSFDRTGRPKDFEVQQVLGHVMFSFRDNSYCEEAFSFTRFDVVDEFMLDATEFATSFTSDFYFSAADKCNTTIYPETQASDDLFLSNLIVGKEYAYCVRAINQKHYMDSPYDGAQFGKSLTSSGATCASHRVRWEASIHGRVTTEPDAGRIPIEDVLVSWELLDDNFKALGCEGCSDSTNTTDGGSFTISFNVLHESLEGRNDDEIPVRIFFSKTSPGTPDDLQHEFLCKNGDVTCDNVNGYIVYLTHLQFKEQMDIYDDTSVPFEGKLFIADTVYPGAQGCPLIDAEVCLIHNNTKGVDETLVCVETETDGSYLAPVIVGGTVDRVQINYYGHEFEPATTNSGAYLDGAGLTILADDFYLNNDFQDISKTNLTVEVVGGECNKQLGESTVLIKIVGCDWGDRVKYENFGIDFGNEFTQSGKYKTYQNLPAHFLRVEVIDIVDFDKVRLTNIKTALSKLVREIDLLESTEMSESHKEQEGKVEEGNGDTGIEDNAPGNATNAIVDSEIEEGQSTVRFQYDGELIMTVTIDKDKDKLDCTSRPRPGEGDSFHVMDYMTIFEVDVTLEYELIKDTLYCDIVDDGLEILIESQVGIDNPKDESWKIFYDSIQNQQTKDALTHCSSISEDTCSLPIKHDLDEVGTKTGRARIDTYTLATGRPNIIDPFTKRITFTALGADRPPDPHVAVVFIEGFYSQGPGNSFALPTYEPIMVLRDPPGGSSQAHYTNVQTTVRAVTSHTESSLGAYISTDILAIAGQTASACFGGGFGAIVLGCTQAAKITNRFGIHIKSTTGGPTILDDDKKSNTFKTTWSYSTSASPRLAGRQSDVFVVPNLNVLYETVYVVTWSNQTCSPIRINENKDWPSKVLFDVNAESSKNSLAFYSRFQIIDQKLPELAMTENTIDLKLNAMVGKENVCCCLKKCVGIDVSHEAPCPDEQEGRYSDGECPKDDEGQGQETCPCTDKDINVMREKKSVIKAGIDGWEKATKIEENTSNDKANIVDWFTTFGEKDMYDEDQLGLGDQTSKQSSAIVSNQLSDEAISLNNGLIRRKIRAQSSINEIVLGEQDVNYLDESGESRRKLDEKDKLKQTNRIQFAGGAGKFAMTMSKTKMEDWHNLACWKGCSTTSDSDIGPISKIKSTLFGFGVDVDIAAGLKIHVEHRSTKGGNKNEETSIGFSLGDPDIRDEFVVEVNFDKRYGTMVFETIAGRSKCPHEANTLANEKPRLKLSGTRNPFVFPDDPMVFEVEMVNEGVGKFSSFQLSSSQSNGSGSMNVVIDGKSVTEDGTGISMKGGTSQTKQIVINRGPNLYYDNPIDITLKSQCDSTLKETRQLWNAINEDGDKVIEWVKPCPEVKWAGDLKRNQGFLVNLNSDYQDKLPVTVLNPLATIVESDNSFNTIRKTGGRLEFVYLRFRKIGTSVWNYAKTSASSMSPPIQNLDFAADYSTEEDAYGYSTVDWNIEPRLVGPGNYEIMVETVCTDIGGPESVNGYQTNVLTGVIDLSRPEQYGEPLPLREEIIAGEEVVIVFTEALECSEPLPFDISVRILDTIDLTQDDLYVRCEGRKIGFQIKLISIQYEDLLGKEFQVEIGKIGDKSVSNVFDANGNSMEYNIVFSRSFAEIDLSASSTSFRLLLENFSGGDGNTNDDVSNKIRQKIASVAGMNYDTRLTLQDVSYDHERQTASATVHIAPVSEEEKGLRRLHANSIDEVHAVSLFYTIQNAMKLENTRKLTSMDHGQDNTMYTIVHLDVIPSSEEMQQFQTHPEREEEERILYQIASTGTDFSLDSPKATEAFLANIMEKKLDKMLQRQDGILSKSIDEKKLDKILQRQDGILAKSIDEKKEMDKMFFYSCVLMVTSVSISIATFLHLRK